MAHWTHFVFLMKSMLFSDDLFCISEGFLLQNIPLRALYFLLALF